MYEIEFSKEAAKHVLLLRKSSPQLFKKFERTGMDGPLVYLLSTNSMAE